jgi:hypothetical protein
MDFGEDHVNDDEAATTIDVIHTTLSGKSYRRSEQYKDDVHLWKDQGHRKWHWAGTRGKLRMIGTIIDG